MTLWKLFSWLLHKQYWSACVAIPVVRLVIQQ